MKHREVKEYLFDINRLISHIIEKKTSIFHLNYALDKNMTALQAAVELINKNIPEELKTLETKIFELGRKIKAGLTEEDKKEYKDLVVDEELVKNMDEFSVGSRYSKKEDIERHAELMSAYNVAMEEENDFVIYKVNPEKLEDLDIEFPFYMLLKKFF
jgi:cob(I)alamin adenosyltransferase